MHSWSRATDIVRAGKESEPRECFIAGHTCLLSYSLLVIYLSISLALAGLAGGLIRLFFPLRYTPNKDIDLPPYPFIELAKRSVPLLKRID